ncbi:protein ELYS isoform X3 [Diaphorina citri]|uniref:Protein ELYS isoform X1 n=1 Tax=Diaphorina citri TaxID=121845 RepID=A0A3Q0IZQ9_DIACI|nr:protein ELYS isoform X1 [Diaphorina citri]XP_026681686.1 protein ELYS isoform X2 [Diaphorina citri]XP_026681687.1 protein ELYS isoform X3 [Diaphorina citri]
MFSTDTQSYHSLLYLFDLDQWFSAQMPEEYNVARSGPRYTALHDLTQVLDARALPISIEVYRSFEKIITSKNRHIQFESYYYPNAYSFHSLALLENEVVALAHLGVHEKALKLMTDGRATCLLQPERYFQLAVKLHLQPLFMDPVFSYHQLEQYSQEEQRQFLLSLLFDLLDDIAFENFLLTSAKEWSLGTFDASGCSVSFLVNWAWGHVTRAKRYVDNLCISLFDFSSTGFDPRDESLLRQFIKQLDTVLRLYRLLSLDNQILSSSTGLDQRIRTLNTLQGYYNTLGGLLFKGLLPETNSLDVWTRGLGIPYPVTLITQYAEQRRTELSNLSAQSLLELPPSGLYMIDSLALNLTQARAPLLREQWGVGGEDCPLYPPPSLQALLRMYLLEEVPAHVKDMLLYYVKLDIQHYMPVAK